MLFQAEDQDNSLYYESTKKLQRLIWYAISGNIQDVEGL